MIALNVFYTLPSAIFKCLLVNDYLTHCWKRMARFKWITLTATLCSWEVLGIPRRGVVRFGTTLDPNYVRVEGKGMLHECLALIRPCWHGAENVPLFSSNFWNLLHTGRKSELKRENPFKLIAEKSADWMSYLTRFHFSCWHEIICWWICSDNHPNLQNQLQGGQF